MAITFFPAFHKMYPPDKPRTLFEIHKHQKYAKTVPTSLYNEWTNFGFGSYGNGLIWTVEPNENILNVDDWEILDGTCIEILRTAFGNICIFQNGYFLWLNPYTKNVTKFPIHIETLFETSLNNKYFKKNILWDTLFKQANKKLGILEADECYGFAPLPMLGGATKKEYLIKIKMRAYLEIISQT